MDEVFNFDRSVGALGLVPRSICKMVGKAVNPGNSKAGRLVEKAHVSKLSQVIFLSTFGVWMERKRREAAWKSRDKVNSKKSALSRHGRRDEQKVDGDAQTAVRRSARILERKIRAQEPDHAGRFPDGVEDRKQPKPGQTAWHGMLLDRSATQHAGVLLIPPTRMDSLATPHPSPHSTPRHLSAFAAAGIQGSVQTQTQGLGLSSSGGPGMNGF